MPATTATAPGKIILFGEHSVVYGRPAIAVPVKQVQARAVVKANPRGQRGAVSLQAPDIGLQAELDELSNQHPLAAAVRLVLTALKLPTPPACSIRVTSTIPIASGLGSGAAISIAVMRAMSAFLGRPLANDQICAMAFEVEKLHHGTPSGIDNTTITYEKPVFYIKGKSAEIFSIPRPFTIVIGDTGLASPTAASVADVRKGWQAKKDLFEAMFDSAGAVAEAARQSLETGMIETLGPLMDANHGILTKMGVSSTELDRLVRAARSAGAWGAKLSGGGRGGNMIALVAPKDAAQIAAALQAAGAVRTIVTQVSGKKPAA
jgi:mevalonate kinase